MNRKMLNGDIIRNSLVNGEGVRHVVFFYGCPHKCKGCHNPQTHDINSGTPFTLEDMGELAKEIAKNDHIDGLTLSGGDPLLRPDLMIEYINEYHRHCSKSLWLYTGYTYKEIMEDTAKRAVCSRCEVVIEGRFEIDKCPTELCFRGSGNQRMFFGPQFYNKTGDCRTYVYGHRNPDVDCLISGYLLEQLSSNTHYVIRRGDKIDDYSRKAFKYITGDGDWIKNLPVLENLHDFEMTFKISVDTEPTEYENTLVSYDHHKHSPSHRGKYRDVRSLGCGATAYLIYKDLIENMSYKFDGEIERYAEMVYKTIYVDTSFLQNERKCLDKDVQDFLQSRHELYRKDSESNLAVYDSLSGVFINGLKIYPQYGNISATYSHISNVALLTEEKVKEITELSKEMENHVAIVYSEGKTHVFYDGKASTLDYFASRGTIIVPWIHKYKTGEFTDEIGNY